jgi:glycosyltransferase involved in cell wall biosynthesis
MARLLVLEPLGRGGIAAYTAEWVTALAADGRAVELVTAFDHRYAFGADAPVRLHPIIRWLRGDPPARRTLRRARLGPVVNARLFVATQPRIGRHARRCGLVHIQGHYHPPLMALTAALMRLVRVPVVHTPHDTFDRFRDHPLARRAVARWTDATVVHVQADLDRVPAQVRDRVVLIPSGGYGALARRSGGAEPRAARAQLGIPEDRVVVLLFGQMRHDKGIRDFVEALLAVPEVSGLLAGEDIGGLRDAADLLERPELRDRLVIREGFLELPEVATCFAAADAVVVPYRVSSQSAVQLLAYAFERPVVIYPVAALQESVVAGETGWVAADVSPPALAQALREVAAAGREECARRGAAGARLAEERYSWAAIARRTEELYARVEQRA